MRSQILISLLFLSLVTQAFGYKQSALDTFLLMNICEKCDLSEANFERADLSGADLLRANLREANLREANLRETKLVEVDFSGADLSGANMRGADLSLSNFLVLLGLFLHQ